MVVSAKAYQVLSCLKLFLVIFTVLFLCTGVIFLATGIYGQLALTHYSELSLDVNLSLVPPVLCGVGGFIILSGLFGFLAAIKNNRQMINFYCCLLSFVLILEVATGIGAFLYFGNFRRSFMYGFRNAIDDPPTNEHPTAMERVQEELKCCGGLSYTDWYYTSWANSSSQQCDGSQTSVPFSCCKPILENNSTTPPNGKICFCGDEEDVDKIYTKGCLEALFGQQDETFHYLLGATFGCALLQLISVIITICIYFKLRELRKPRRY